MALHNVNFCSSSRKTSALGGLTTPLRPARPTGQTGICLIFRGFNVESDDEIGQKEAFFKGIKFLGEN